MVIHNTSVNQELILTSTMPILNPGTTRIVLASQSPRRIELLRRIIPEFEVKGSDIEENTNGFTDPRQLVERLSRLKAEKVAPQIQEGIVIGADSVVALDDKILGKPRDASDCYVMLNSLSDRFHQVYTGFTIIKTPENTLITDHEVTDVKFRRLENWEIEHYIESGQPLDKAGAYGIQDDGAVFVESITGCYYNVVGLPITKIFLALKKILGEEGKN